MTNGYKKILMDMLEEMQQDPEKYYEKVMNKSGAYYESVALRDMHARWKAEDRIRKLEEAEDIVKTLESQERPNDAKGLELCIIAGIDQEWKNRQTRNGQEILEKACEILGIQCKFEFAEDYDVTEEQKQGV